MESAWTCERDPPWHAAVVLLGVLVWTWIWGPWGPVLAVPMLVIVKSIADHVESLQPVSRLMSL